MLKNLLAIFLLFSSVSLQAQKPRGINDTIRLGGIVMGNDTLPHIWLRDVWIYSKLTDEQRAARIAQRQAYNQLRRNVFTVYPYAVQAGFALQEIDSALTKIYSKDAKRVFKRRKEDQLNKEFKDRLENLSITQGQILVKLIARQTGKPCYQIIKDLKGGLNARLWQTVALLFENNLKNNYDPQGNDQDIEAIVQEIERRGHFIRK